MERLPKLGALGPAESAGTGTKYDGSKPRMGLVPPIATLAVAEVMTHGAAKYGIHNYLGGMNHSRLHDAALRHLNAWVRGEGADPDSGLPHLAHAAASVMMMLELQALGLGVDDRWAASCTEAGAMTKEEWEEKWQQGAPKPTELQHAYLASEES